MLSQANPLSHLGNLIASIYKVRSLTNPGFFHSCFHILLPTSVSNYTGKTNGHRKVTWILTVEETELGLGNRMMP